jgi:endonuclease-3
MFRRTRYLLSLVNNLPSLPKSREELIEQFLTQYSIIRKQRDELGFQYTPEQVHRNIPSKSERFTILIGFILSARTRDHLMMDAIKKLQQYGLTVENIANADEGDLRELIKDVSHYDKKASWLIRTSKLLLEEFDGDVPDTIEGLTSLPGVGPKVGYLTLNHAWGKAEGIAVDVHCHRVANRLGLVQTSTPEQTRLELESYVPKEHWEELSTVLVGHGHAICKFQPLCSKCDVRDTCAFNEQQLV